MTCERMVPHLREGQLVVLESTTYLARRRKSCAPFLEKFGSVAGEHFRTRFILQSGEDSWEY